MPVCSLGCQLRCYGGSEIWYGSTNLLNNDATETVSDEHDGLSDSPLQFVSYNTRKQCLGGDPEEVNIPDRHSQDEARGHL